jgi:hypothetical protein
VVREQGVRVPVELTGGMDRRKSTFCSPKMHLLFGVQFCAALGNIKSDGGRDVSLQAIRPRAGTRFTVHVGVQDFVGGHLSGSSQRLGDFGFLPGPTHLPGRLQLAFDLSLFCGLGWQVQDDRN